MSPATEPGRPAAPPASGPRRVAWRRYALAVAAVALAAALLFALQVLLGPERMRVPFAFFFAAVLVATWYGGRGPGLLAAALSALIGDYLFLPPYRGFSFGPDGLLQVGAFLMSALVVVYVTEKMTRAEESARASREWLSTTLRSIGDAVVATDAEARVTFMNRVAQDLTGWPEQEAVGRPLAEVFPIVNEQTREAVESPVARVLREGKVVGLANHTILVRRDGTEVPIDDSAAPLRDADGRVTGAVLVFHEITERKRAEEQLRRRERELTDFFENAVVGLHWVGPDGRILRANRAELELLGYAPEEYIGHHIAEFHADQDAIQDLLSRLQAGELLHEYEARLRCKDGSIRHVLIDSSVMWRGGEFVHTRCFTRDITEQKRSEEEREELLAREQAARAEAERAAERTARLQAITAALSEALTPAEVASTIVEHGLGSLGAQAGAVVLLDEAGAELNLMGTLGLPPEVAERWGRFPLGARVPIAEAVRAREPVLLASAEDWGDRFPQVGPLGEVNQHRSLAAFPLIAEGGRALGAIGLVFSTPRKLDEADRDYMQALARQCAQALERARLYEAERRSRAEIEASEWRYRALADAMPQIVWTARADGYVDYHNKRWVEYTGLPLEQTRGWGWQPALHPEDLEKFIRAWARSVQTGENFVLEFRLKRAADAAYRWHLGRAEPMRDGGGEIVRWFGTSTDIHARKQAEESVGFLAEASVILASSLDYETTLEQLARLSVASLADYCVIDIVEGEGRVRRVAAAHADPLAAELLGGLRRFPPDGAGDEGIPAVLSSGRPLVVSELSDERLAALARAPEHAELLRRLGLKSFMTVPLVARGRTVGALTFALTRAGRSYGAADLAFAEELARRAALAVDNARLYRRAKEANRAKDEFLATLSHELRTPLTPIIGWVHMIRSGRINDADAAQGLGVIDKNSQALSRLINDLLDMSSILSGKMRIERAPVPLVAAVREAVETVRPQAGGRGVTIETSFGAGCEELVVSGDRTRLVQVFWNLLHNAVKFSAAEGRVRVECEADGAGVRVSVADEGQGIPAGFLPHVFERFRQADGSTTRTHGGLGIGLALVKSFTEAHGGSVRAESDGAGRGSRFTVTLPLAPAPAAADDGEPEEGPACAPDACRVLVVEDARDTLDMLRVIFEARGYRATLCETAEQALRLAPTMWFDIVVSDIGLPRVDGYEFIQRLRTFPHLRDIPAVALTGYAATKDAESALAAGFDLHIPKPVDPAALSAAVEQLLHERVRQDVPDA